MSRLIIIQAAALDDLQRQFDYIAYDNLDAARRYLRAWQSAFDRLADMPGLGTVRDFGVASLTGMRMWPVPRFPNYLIFYRYTDSELHVIRVLHGAQDIPNILG